jgi:hypothetical protein
MSDQPDSQRNFIADVINLHHDGGDNPVEYEEDDPLVQDEDQNAPDHGGGDNPIEDLDETHREDDADGEDAGEEKGRDDDTKKAPKSSVEVDELREQLDQLRQTIGQLTAAKATPSAEELVEAQEELEEVSEQLEAVEFVKDPSELLDVMRNPAKFNELMNKLLGAATQHTLRAVPRVVSTTVSRTQALAKAREDFYSANPELANHKQFIGYLASQIQQKEPNLAMPELLDKVAEMAYSQLALSKRAAETDRRERVSENKPAFPSKKRTTRTSQRDAPEPTTQQRQIAEILQL